MLCGIGRAGVVDEQEPTLVEVDTTIGRQQTLRIRASSNGDDQLIEGEVLFAGFVLVPS